ncbi:OmpW/AlkL family protein [Rhodovulum sulfidophilum]|uniref:OmpW family protein n=1 Tax=Rhodovulum sulfidophilum TaxID=35806 RepID=A0ABS1RST5_RHOSU|nr:OmpW family outer membrane protein [Rhodovulum sulfidophilum]MBL3609139.1 OmpW family protein [Rhodovulum sulfidophilum]MCE8456919.1 outer membrane beta-barrel protein [Rhodovulum sulfidophilum]
MKTSLLAIALTATALAGSAADAQSKGDWTFGLGLGYVSPKSDNGTLAGAESHVGDNARPTITFEYFFADNWGVEVLGALPFKHNINIDGVGKADTLQLPPVVSLQYHFVNSSSVTPFLGAGLNYTTFWDTDSALGDVDIEDSWGLALHAGLDYAIDERHSIRTDVRWIDIDSDVKLNGGKIGTAHIDPWVFGVSYIWKF